MREHADVVASLVCELTLARELVNVVRDEGGLGGPGCLWNALSALAQETINITETISFWTTATGWSIMWCRKGAVSGRYAK